MKQTNSSLETRKWSLRKPYMSQRDNEDVGTRSTLPTKLSQSRRRKMRTQPAKPTTLVHITEGARPHAFATRHDVAAFRKGAGRLNYSLCTASTTTTNRCTTGTTTSLAEWRCTSTTFTVTTSRRVTTTSRPRRIFFPSHRRGGGGASTSGSVGMGVELVLHPGLDRGAGR